MIVAAKNADQFCAKPPKDCGLFLVFGPATTLVQQRFMMLRKASQVSSDNQITLSQDDFKGQAGLLSFHADSVSLFGDKRLILLRDIRDADLAKAVEKLLEQGFDAQQTWFLIEAGDLAKTSKLRKLCEAHPNCGALICYEEDAQTLMPFVRQQAQIYAFELDAANAQIMIEACSFERAAIIDSFEKLGLYYSHAPQEPSAQKANSVKITLDFASFEPELTALIFGSHVDTSAQVLLDLALSGDLAGFIQALKQFPVSDEAWQGLIWFAQTQLLMLEDLLLKINSSGQARAVIDAHRPPIFWKRKASVGQQIAFLNANGQGLAKVRGYSKALIEISEKVRGGGYSLQSTLGQLLLRFALGART